ncbi:MAG: deoxyribonuclease IV [Bacteroidales bacterium]|jgi:deoxyribonuclease-4|nr:deoxyribonuclease IV [Bacteroidales bacterium]
MLNIGCHLSLSGGYENMGRDALSIGANTFQFFSRNPRGGTARTIYPKDVAALETLMSVNNFAPLLAHAPYTLNLCSQDASVRRFAREMMRDDLQRMELLPCHLYNFHPGSHTGQGIEAGINLIIEGLNEVMFDGQKTVVLLETMSGKGSEVGGKFEELRTIIDGVRMNDKIGVCLDTCHIYDAGYDIVGALDEVIERFDEIIGLERLYAIHLNDDKNPYGSRKDRHETIGDGTIGLQGLKAVINHPKLRLLPFLLETPNELDGYAREIALLKSIYNQN